MVISLFYNHFEQLEDSEALHPDNELDVWCLHFVYLPRINHALKEFQETLWNDHKISNTAGSTPKKLFIRGPCQHYYNEDFINLSVRHAGSRPHGL